MFFENVAFYLTFCSYLQESQTDNHRFLSYYLEKAYCVKPNLYPKNLMNGLMILFIRKKSDFLKRSFSTLRASPSVRTRWLGPYVNFGMLELTFQGLFL